MGKDPSITHAPKTLRTLLSHSMSSPRGIFLWYFTTARWSTEFSAELVTRSVEEQAPWLGWQGSLTAWLRRLPRCAMCASASLSSEHMTWRCTAVTT